MKNNFFLISLSFITLNLQGSQHLQRERASKIIELIQRAPIDAAPKAQKFTLDQRILGEKFDDVFAKLREAQSTGATRGQLFDILAAYGPREFTK